MKTSFLKQYGKPLLDHGYPIIPIRRGYKWPRGLKNWQQTQASDALLDKWLSNGFADGGVGVLTERVPAIDLDIRDKEIVELLVDWCRRNIGGTVQRVGEAPKTLLVFRTDTPFTKITSPTYTDMFGYEHRIEILGKGQQFVAFADHPTTERPYEWVSEKTLAETPYEDLPYLTATKAQALLEYFGNIVPSDWEIVAPSLSSKVQPNSPLETATPSTGTTPANIRKCLNQLESTAADYHSWVEMGMALYHEFGGSQNGLDLWDEWSSTAHNYDPKIISQKWLSFEADLSRKPVTFATIIQKARTDYAKSRKEAVADKAKFKLIHAQDILAKLGPIKWQIEGFLEQDTTGLIFGDPGSFKSFIALDMAFHVAAGKDWHGHKVKQGSVIYIAGEGHGGLARRFAAWQNHHEIDLSELPFYVSQQAAQFYDENSANDVVRAVEAISRNTEAPALIVIDTLARNFGGGDENSNTDMGVFLAHVDGLLRARFGATVAIVHHSGHSHKERARGATALKGGMDFEYRVEKADGLKARLTCTKMKDAREPEEQWFEGREIIVGDFSEDMTSLVFETSTPSVFEVKTTLKGKQKALFDLIEHEAPIERDRLREVAISEGIFENSRQFRDTLAPLKEKELIEEIGNIINILDPFFGGADGRGFSGDIGAENQNPRLEGESAVSL